jgi:DNA polymerase I-like protein with 3'-5' exonuclease and polymerase domains
VKSKKPTLLQISRQAEPMSTAGPERAWCVICGLGSSAGYVLPRVPQGWKAGKRILLLGSWDAEARAYARKIWVEAGYTDQDFILVDIVRCGSEPTMQQVRACRPYILQALQTIEPSTVLCFGRDGMRAVTNSTEYTNVMTTRGTLLSFEEHPRIPVYATFAVADCLGASTHYRALLLQDFTRLSWPVVEWPQQGTVSGDVVGLDSEYTPSDVLCFGIADKMQATQIACVDTNTLVPAKTIVGQNIFVDLDAAMRCGWELKDEWLRGVNLLDSYLLARMTDENRGKGAYNVETLLQSAYNVKGWKHKTDAISESDPTQWGPDLMHERVRLDAWASVLVADYFHAVARGPVQLTHRIASVLHRIRLAGVALDLQRLDAVSGELQSARTRSRDLLCKAAFAEGMTEFEPTNDGHLRELLFKKLLLPVIEKTENGAPSVAKTTLTAYRDIPVVQLLSEFNEADKTLQTLTGEKGILPNVTGTYSAGETSYYHVPVNINPLTTRTARRSSSSPNMQNWKPEMQRLVRSRFPGGKILNLDYSSLEPCILGWVAQDDKYLHYFQSGKGYVGVAKEIFGQVIEKGTPHYKAIKGVVLGSNYGSGPKKVASQLWNATPSVRLSEDYEKHVEEVASLRTKYLRAFPGIQRYMYARREELLRNGCVRSLTGRVRHMPVPQGQETPGFGHFLNAAYNFPIQSLASEVTGSAMIDCEAALLTEFGLSYRAYHHALLRREWPQMPILVNEVHDELVFDIPALSPEQERRCVELIVERMCKVPTLRTVCPKFTLELKVSHVLAETWGCKE